MRSDAYDGLRKSDLVEPIRVIVVDRRPVLRMGLTALFAQHPDLQVVAEASDTAGAQPLVRELKPDVVVTTDLQAPGARWVLLAAAPEAGLVERALGAGASGVLLEDEAPDVIVAAVRAAHAGQLKLGEELAADFASRVGRPRINLTARERDVLEGLARGENNRQLAATLAIEETTVKAHLARLFAKLDVSGRLAAVATARRMGLLPERSPR